MVANVSPPIMVTAISAKNASNSIGAIPKIVVRAAKVTGRKRLNVASIMAFLVSVIFLLSLSLFWDLFQLVFP